MSRGAWRIFTTGDLMAVKFWKNKSLLVYSQFKIWLPFDKLKQFARVCRSLAEKRHREEKNKGQEGTSLHGRKANKTTSLHGRMAYMATNRSKL